MVDENTFFREATLRLCGDLDIEKAMTDFLRYVRNYMPADRLILERHDEASGAIRSVVVATPEGTRRTDEPMPISDGVKSEIEEFFREGIPEPYFLNDPYADPTAKEILDFQGLRASALMYLPLSSADREPAGLVVIAEEGRYDDSQLRLMSLLRAPFQVAMANTRHYAEVERLNDALAIENRRLYRRHAQVYLGLRKAVGLIGILLPFALMFGNFLVFRGDFVLRSISRYYHTGMRNVFVAALCSVALFMFFYSGSGRRERWAGIFAGFFTLGVVFFPTTMAGPTDRIGTVHYASAALLFLLLSWISLVHFPRKRPGQEKQWTDVVQRICGILMLACVVSMVVYVGFMNTDGRETSFVFIAETVALIAFGLSWLTEGIEMEMELAANPVHTPRALSTKISV